jgi:hypothetical protein
MESSGWPLDATAVATMISALAALAVATLAFRQLGQLKRQVDQAEVGVAAASRSADAARDAALEASRGRADSTAPLVVALVESPQWPAFLDAVRTSMPGGGELPLLAVESLHRARMVAEGERFVFPVDAQQLLWFRMSGTLTNEGATTARVRLGGEAQFVAGRSEEGVAVHVPLGLGSGVTKTYALRPGQTACFEWAAGLTLGRWAEASASPQGGRGFLEITVTDSREHGVIDHIFVLIAGRPLQPDPQRDGQWRLVGPESLGLTVYPTRRTYRWDWPTTQEPPWNESRS